jgi:TusA-related sulfurtransferase
MGSENVVKVNARGLSNPGPRMMVETALAKGPCRMMRVIVSNEEAAADLDKFFATLNAVVDIDKVGEEYHILADFTHDINNV